MMPYIIVKKDGNQLVYLHEKIYKTEASARAALRVLKRNQNVPQGCRVYGIIEMDIEEVPE